MIKVEHIETWGFEHAIRAMRNPMNSWDKSDSHICIPTGQCEKCKYIKDYHFHRYGSCYISQSTWFYIGKNDLDLMQRLYKAGHPHRKYLRQIFVSMDITAPLYWWKEMDTYKVGTVANSCSTMHKIHDKEFTLDDFSHEHLTPVSESVMDTIIRELNSSRDLYLTYRDKEYWWQMIQLLPTSYNQKRTITMNYENVVSMISQRLGHKLDEWREFIEILCMLPHLEEIVKGE